MSIYIFHSGVHHLQVSILVPDIQHLPYKCYIYSLLSLFSIIFCVVGYIFFDVFNQNVLQNPVFKSIKFPAKEGDVNTKCLSFWFSPFGRSDITSLSIYQTVQGDVGDADIGESGPPPSAGGSGSGSDGSAGNRVLLWSIQTRKFDTRRAQWYYGQTKVEASTPHEVSPSIHSLLLSVIVSSEREENVESEGIFVFRFCELNFPS